MKIKDQLLTFEAALDAWAKRDGGTARIAGDKTQIVGILSAKPGAPRVACLFLGETPRGEENAAQASMVDRVFWFIVSRGQGFKLDRGDSLTDGSGGGRPMFDLVEEVRDVARCVMLGEGAERPTYYAGIQPFDAGEGMMTDAYVIEVKVGTYIGVVSGDPQEGTDE